MGLEIQEERVLIDKVQYYNIGIYYIEDIGSLERQEIISRGNGRSYYCEGNEAYCFKSLRIHDDFIMDMRAGCTNTGLQYCNLRVNIRDKSRTNVRCWTLEEHKEHLHKIEEHLITRYGIHADFSDVLIKQIEINKTFVLDQKFADYYRVLQIMMHRLPYPYKHQNTHLDNSKSGIETNTYYAVTKQSNKTKNYTELKIYNKKKMVQAIISIEEELMRVEFTLYGSEKVRKSLGANELVEITEDSISSYFNQQIDKIITTQIEKWKKERDAFILKIMKEEHDSSNRYWIVNTLRKIEDAEIVNHFPIVLDVEEVVAQVNNLEFAAVKQKSVKKQFRKQAKKYESALCNRDDMKLDEILRKLTSESGAVTKLHCKSKYNN